MVLILRGDAAQLPLPDASVDAVVCDPPYADQLTIFGKMLATVAPHAGQSVEDAILAWTIGWARECWRVLKPHGTAIVFSSAATFRFLSSEVPPILLGVTRDVDLTPLFSPTRRRGALDQVGFRFHRLHTWMYGTGNPRGTGTKPAWEAIVEVRKHLTPPPPTPVTRIDLSAALRDLLPKLTPQQRATAQQILATPHDPAIDLWEHPAFQGVFDQLRPPLTLTEVAEGLPATWEPGQHFYVPKPSVREQNDGLDDLPARVVKKFGPAKIRRQNTHPTPKPVA